MTSVTGRRRKKRVSRKFQKKKCSKKEKYVKRDEKIYIIRKQFETPLLQSAVSFFFSFLLVTDIGCLLLISLKKKKKKIFPGKSIIKKWKNGFFARCELRCCCLNILYFLAPLLFKNRKCKERMEEKDTSVMSSEELLWRHENNSVILFRRKWREKKQTHKDKTNFFSLYLKT